MWFLYLGCFYRERHPKSSLNAARPIPSTHPRPSHNPRPPTHEGCVNLLQEVYNVCYGESCLTGETNNIQSDSPGSCDFGFLDGWVGFQFWPRQPPPTQAAACPRLRPQPTTTHPREACTTQRLSKFRQFYLHFCWFPWLCVIRIRKDRDHKKELLTLYTKSKHMFQRGI